MAFLVRRVLALGSDLMAPRRRVANGNVSLATTSGLHVCLVMLSLDHGANLFSFKQAAPSVASSRILTAW